MVTQISEVVRYDPDEKQIVLTDIFNYRNGGRCCRPATCRRSSIAGGEGAVGPGVSVRAEVIDTLAGMFP